MITRSKILSGVVVSLIGAIFLTKFFYHWPDLFPTGLRALGNSLVSLSGFDSVEISSDIEISFVLLVCFVFSGLLFLVLTSAHSWLAHRHDA